VIGAGHQPHQPLRGGLGALQRALGLPRAEHRHPVGDLADLVHPVRDEQRGHAAGAARADHLEQPVPGGDVQRRRRLVEDEQPRLAQQDAGDRARLPLGQRQRAGRRVQVDVAAEQFGEHCAGPRLADGFRQLRAEHGVRAEPGVLQDRAGIDDEHFLEHRHDPRPAGRAGVAQRWHRHQLPVGARELERPGVRPVHPGEDLHQGGLA
jgi:hypothetical protein